MSVHVFESVCMFVFKGMGMDEYISVYLHMSCVNNM